LAPSEGDRLSQKEDDMAKSQMAVNRFVRVR